MNEKKKQEQERREKEQDRRKNIKNGKVQIWVKPSCNITN